MARAPHTEAAESGRLEDPTTLKNLPRDPLLEQDMTWMDTQRERAKQKPWGQVTTGGDEEETRGEKFGCDQPS